jgi:putative membrane protein
MALGTCPMQGSGFFGIGYGWIFQIIIFILFFLVVWWLMKNNSSAFKQEKAPNENPADILKRRLAKGEITKKEFEELKKDIE